MKKRIISVLLVLIIFLGLVQNADVFSQKKAENTHTFTAFFFANGYELQEDNVIQQMITEKVGAKCIEYWSNDENKQDIINEYAVTGEYPDFISGVMELYEKGVLIPIDEYWENYPNIRALFTEEEWNLLRQDDGHIYWIPQFGNSSGNSEEQIHNGEAFWIQNRVLKWAGYPTITTMDQYFKVIEDYLAANPYMEDGVTKNIGYTILCDDWRYFCLENAPQFLDGYPNDGCCMVNPDTLEIMDYNVTPTAKAYFKKLNEEYKKGIVDPESFTSSYSEYLAKISSGAVLGMIDQRWEFYYDTLSTFESKGLDEMGCEYVPLPITMNESIKGQWHSSQANEFDVGTGLAITTSCDDITAALQFVDDLLREDIMLLRYWGVEGKDYAYNDKGELYALETNERKAFGSEAAKDYYCYYSYFPHKSGLMEDGINNYLQEYQKREFQDGLSDPLKECFEAYHADNFIDLIGDGGKPGPWYPMYSFTDQLTYNSEEGRVWKQLAEVKHYWLPQVVMADDFESFWNQYMRAYQDCNPEIVFDAMQEEVYRRVAMTK